MVSASATFVLLAAALISVQAAIVGPGFGPKDPSNGNKREVADCAVGYTRCADGLCVPEGDACTDTIPYCPFGTDCPQIWCPQNAPLLCADGACVSTWSDCEPFYACLPGEKLCNDRKCRGQCTEIQNHACPETALVYFHQIDACSDYYPENFNGEAIYYFPTYWMEAWFSTYEFYAGVLLPMPFNEDDSFIAIYGANHTDLEFLQSEAFNKRTSAQNKRYIVSDTFATRATSVFSFFILNAPSAPEFYLEMVANNNYNPADLETEWCMAHISDGEFVNTVQNHVPTWHCVSEVGYDSDIPSLYGSFYGIDGFFSFVEDICPGPGCFIDCNGIPNGPSQIDPCGVCNGDASTCADCTGMPWGTQQVDACGVCGGDGTTCCHEYLTVENELWDFLLAPIALDDMIGRVQNTIQLLKWIQEHLPAECSHEYIGDLAQINKMFLDGCLEEFCDNAHRFAEGLAAVLFAPSPVPNPRG